MKLGSCVKPVQRDGIRAVDFHVALDLLQSLADVLHEHIVIRLRGGLVVINSAWSWRVRLFGLVDRGVRIALSEQRGEHALHGSQQFLREIGRAHV